MLIWNDGRVAEVYKEDPLYATISGSSTPGIQYVPTLIVKANENYCFYGNGVQIDDVVVEYERLKMESDNYVLEMKEHKKIGLKSKIALPQIPKLQIQFKTTGSTEEEIDE